MRLVIRDLLPGKNYTLQFRSKDATGAVSDWSRFFRVDIAALNTKPAAPAGVTLTSSGDSFVANWNRVTTAVDGTVLPDVTGYVVKFKNLSTGQEATFDTTATSFELTYNLNIAAFAQLAGRLGVQVAAKTYYSQSDWSTEVIAQNPPPNPVQNLHGQSILDGIAVDWDEPLNLEPDFLEYRAYAGTSADFAINDTNMFWRGVGTNAVYHISLQNNYYIKVVAVDKFNSVSTAATVGPFTPKSTTDADATAPSTPTGLSGTISGNTLTVNWTKVSDPDVVGYRIAYRPAGTTIWSYATAGRDDSSSIIQPIDLYRNYEVQVWSHDNSFNYSNPTSVLGVTAPADTGAGSVTGIALEAGVNTAIATWTPVNSSLLKNYEIQFANVPLTSETVGTISSVFGSRHDFAGLVPGTYYARIRTVSVGGVKSAWSSTAQATIAKGDGKVPSSSPTPTVMDGIAAIYATWPEISNVDLVSYEVHASATSGFTPSASTRIGDTSGTVMSIRGFANGTPLTAGTPYYIRIVAKDADGAAAAGAQAGPAKLSQAATQNDLNSLTSTVNKSLKTTTVEYAVNTSETTAPTSGWSTATPTRTAGQFIWYRTTLSYNDGTSAVTNPALLTGNTGATGPAGAATYTWIKYADTPTSGMSDLPDGKTYMGIATNKSTATESSTYSDYQWSLIKGQQGIAGPAGADGIVYYTWIKYATDVNGANLSDDPTGRPYLGIAYNKTTATESTNAADYSWSLIQGAAGAQGPQGIPGPAGTNGASLYTWLKYADTPTTGMSDSPTGKTYMGIAYNKTSSTESSNYADYEWSLIQGAQGVAGPAGADGQPTYTWVKYATSSTGAGMSDSPTGMTYIGLAFNKNTATESTVATDYTWSLIQGPQGAQGPQGIQGSAGVTYYTWLKYASSTTPAAADMSDSPDGKTYMGIAVNKTTATESTVYTDYTWSLIKGDQGVPGPAGANGQTTYTWVKYASDASGTGLSDDPTGKTYIGLATNKTTATESTVASDYTWSLFQGPQGVAGPAGAAAATVSLTASTQVLSLAAGATVTNPTTSTITGTAVNTTITQWLYAIDGGAFSTTVPAGVSRSGNVVTITGQTMTAKVITVKMADANNVSDTLSVVKVSDGATGATGSTGATGPAGTSGADAYTVLLSNEAQTFAGSQTAALAGSATSQVIAYKGTAQQTATIGTITGAPTGMTVAVTNNGTTTAGFTVTVTTSLTQQNGTLTVPITVAGVSFTKTFAWSIAFQGATGSQGIQGPTGPSGQTYYTWVKYASSTTPAAADMSDDPTGKTYMGIAVNKASSTESTVYTDYSWSLIKGDQGIAGPAGTNGQTTYTWVKYANDASGTGMSDDPTGKPYLGLAYNKTTATESTVATDYSWSLIQGATGATGPTGPTGATGTPAAVINLTATTQVLSLAAGATATNPTTSTVTGTATNTTITQWLYAVDGGAFSTTVPAGVSRTNNVVTITGQTMTAKTITVKMADSGTAQDTITVAKVSDGATGATGPTGSTGATGPAGTSGADGYTVILTNEAQVFAGTATTAQAGSATAQVIAYKGATQMPATIGTITGMPTGMTVALTNNGTTTAGFTVTVTTSLTQKSGTLTVPITVDGKAFTSIFSWSISFTGATGPTGATGANGVGVSSVTPYYLQQSSASAAPAQPTTNPPGGAWTTTEPAYAVNTSLYRTDQVMYTNSTFAYTAVSKMSAYQAADLALTTANGKNKITYSTGTPGTTANTAGDIWFQKDANNVIIAQWEGAGGTSWIPKTLGNSVIANLDAGKITTGYLDAARLAAGTITAGSAIIADAAIVSAKIASLDANKITAGTGLIANLTVKSTLTMGDASTNGIIQSYGYNGANGYYMDKSQLIINNGSVAAAALKIQYGQNLMEPLFADFEGQSSYYSANIPNNSATISATIVQGGYFGSQALQVTMPGTAAAGTWSGVRLANDPTTYPIFVEAGKTYIVSMYIKGMAAATRAVPRLTWQDGTYTDVFNITTAANQAYTRYNGFVTVPAGKTKARVDIWSDSVASGSGFIVDAIQVEERIGALNTPSSWTPPSTTSIDGGMIRTGEIRSNQTIMVNGVAQPMWSINMNGGAQFGSALIRGSLTVGTTGDADSSYIISANYSSTAGAEAGFLLRGSDGYASFRKIDIALDSSVAGSIIVGNQLDRYTKVDSNGIASYMVMATEGGYTTTPLMTAGNFGETGFYASDSQGEILAGIGISTDPDTLVQSGVVFSENASITNKLSVDGKGYFGGPSADVTHENIESGPVINGQAMFGDKFLGHFERHPNLGIANKWFDGLAYGNIEKATRSFSLGTAKSSGTGIYKIEVLKFTANIEYGRTYSLYTDAGWFKRSGGTRSYNINPAWGSTYVMVSGNGTDIGISSTDTPPNGTRKQLFESVSGASTWHPTQNIWKFTGGFEVVTGTITFVLMFESNANVTFDHQGPYAYMYLDDEGTANRENWPVPTGITENGTTTATTTTTSTVKEYTKTYVSDSTQVWNGNSSPDTIWNKHLIGGWSQGGRQYRSYAGFPTFTVDLSGATVKKVEVYLYRHYGNASGPTSVGLHDTATLGSTEPSITHIGNYTFTNGSGRWISIPSTYWAGFKSGTYRGISVGRKAGTPGNEHWSEYRKHSEYYPPKVRITYAK